MPSATLGAPPTPTSTAPLRPSALDLMPLRDGQSTGQAIAATLRAAQTADAAGFTRDWMVEHHNMPTFAITTSSRASSHDRWRSSTTPTSGTCRPSSGR